MTLNFLDTASGTPVNVTAFFYEGELDCFSFRPNVPYTDEDESRWTGIVDDLLQAAREQKVDMILDERDYAKTH